MSDYEAMAEAIKNLEPALREKGLAPSWEKFNRQFQEGNFSETESIQKAIDDSAGDKLEWFDGQEKETEHVGLLRESSAKQNQQQGRPDQSSNTVPG